MARRAVIRGGSPGGEGRSGRVPSSSLLLPSGLRPNTGVYWTKIPLLGSWRKTGSVPMPSPLVALPTSVANRSVGRRGRRIRRRSRRTRLPGPRCGPGRGWADQPAPPCGRLGQSGWLDPGPPAQDEADWGAGSGGGDTRRERPDPNKGRCCGCGGPGPGARWTGAHQCGGRPTAPPSKPRSRRCCPSDQRSGRCSPHTAGRSQTDGTVRLVLGGKTVDFHIAHPTLRQQEGDHAASSGGRRLQGRLLFLT